jgi:hypothetical protein
MDYATRKSGAGGGRGGVVLVRYRVNGEDEYGGRI